MLAGLASSEMTRAQYDRAFGAQLQSKAGDQWSFFQAKRVRSAIQRNSSDLLQTLVELHPFDSVALKNAAEQLPESAKAKGELLALVQSPAGQQALSFLQKGELPPIPPGPALEPNLKTAIEAVESSRPDAEFASLLAQISNNALEEALRAAREQAQAFDAETKPVNQTIDALEGLLAQTKSVSSAFGLSREFTAARLRYAAARYEAEARLNQVIANLYELQVRKSNISAERHHARSQRFFFGMLGAQLAVIISTFAIAARQRNLLWSLAAAAGLGAIALAIYVYLYV
jgi:protein-L-isoaspartate O-methyltransferase